MFINDFKKKEKKTTKILKNNDVNVVICTTKKMQSIERSVTLIRNV